MQASTPAASLLRTRTADPARTPAAEGDGAPTGGGAPGVAAVDSSALLQGQKAVAISHNGSVYRLQATKLGKLILTK